MREIENLIQQRIEAALAAFYPPEPMTDPPEARPCTILVPVYNGASNVRRCLQSLLLHADSRHGIVIADDCSTDLRLSHELSEWPGRYPHVRYIRRTSNLGYLDNVNALLEETDGDVLLLNSDTEIGPQCVDRLQRAAYCADRVALACPLSDNATLLTVAPAEWLAQFSTEDIQAACARAARAHFPRLPTAVGFCMYLRRDALAALGSFDRFFAPGYGEEDDYAQRARREGWQLVAAPDVFVRHAGGVSFGRTESISALQSAHLARLTWRWPSYESDVRTWWRDWPLREHVERVRIELSRHAKPRRRILHVLHRLNRIGGTENIARGLIDALQPSAEQTVVAVDPLGTLWADAVEGRLTCGARTLTFNSANVQPNQIIAGLPADLSDPALERSFARLLRGGCYDLVHVHHLAGWNSLLIPGIARALGVPVVLGLHDHYTLCPDPQMIRMPGSGACEKRDAVADAECESCLSRRRQTRLGSTALPAGTYLAARRVFLRKLLSDCSALIAPSQYLARRVTASEPETTARLHVIPHGLSADDISSTRIAAKTYVPQPRLRVGFLGGGGAYKGFGLIEQLAQSLQGHPIQFLAYGIDGPDSRKPWRSPKSASEDLTTAPGGAELPNLVQYLAVSPSERAWHLATFDLILLPSLMAESFSLVLSEANAMGVPAIASDRGAFVERIRHGVDGWRLDAADVEAWRSLLLELSQPEGRARLGAIRNQLLSQPVRTLDAQAQDYLDIYEAIWRHLHHPPDGIPAASKDPASLRLQQISVGPPVLHPLEFVRPRASRIAPQVIAIARDLWAQSQYRVHLPLAQLAASGLIEKPAVWCSRHQSLPQAAEVLQMDPDTVVFLHGLDAPTMALMSALRSATSRPRLVFLLDDLLDCEDPRIKSALTKAAQLCDRLVCTTRPLAKSVRSELQLPAEKVTVVENALPIHPWSELERPFPVGSSPLRVLWAGASQHQADLDLLLPVVEATKTGYRWVFMGLCPKGVAGDPQIEFHPGVEFNAYPAALAALRADIAVAPLVDTPFNRCKSALKLMEYGALGLPVIASALTPYASAPVLRAASHDEWLAALRELRDPLRRRTLGSALQSWVRDHHWLSSDVTLHQWRRALMLPDSVRRTVSV